MLTLDRIKALTPEQRTTEFERLAIAQYGTSYKTALGADFGTVRQTVGKWVRENTVPIETILALEAMRMHDAAAQLGGLIRELTE